MACIIVHDICVLICVYRQAAAVGCNVAHTAESAGLVGCPVHPYQTFRAAPPSPLPGWLAGRVRAC